MQFATEERAAKFEESRKSELILDKYSCLYAEKIANLVEKELEKGKPFDKVFTSCYDQANIPVGANFMGAIYHNLIRNWKHGEDLRNYLKISSPIVSEFIGIR